MNTMTKTFSALTIVLGAGFGFYYYSQGVAASESEHENTQALAPAPPAVDVIVQTVIETNLRLWSEFSGRLQAVDFAEIRPEVSGRIAEVRFTDGQAVEVGDVLFVIDPRPFKAAVARAEAKLASAKSDAQFAKADQERFEMLIESNAIARRELDQATNANGVAESNQQAAEAELESARLDLEHAYVKAPISGRVSRAEITVGNLVPSGASAPVLTSIASEKGIYADFDVDEQTYMEMIRNAASGNEQEGKIPVQLLARGDRDTFYDGFIQSFDNRINPESGTIRARARFENQDGALVPGMFVSVKLASSESQAALLVQERAITADQSRKFVYVVDADNKVVYREVTLGKSVRDQRIVEQGLQAGDRVIVDGVQRVKPDTRVTAMESTVTPATPDINLAATLPAATEKE